MEIQTYTLVIIHFVSLIIKKMNLVLQYNLTHGVMLFEEVMPKLS